MSDFGKVSMGSGGPIDERKARGIRPARLASERAVKTWPGIHPFAAGG